MCTVALKRGQIPLERAQYYSLRVEHVEQKTGLVPAKRGLLSTPTHFYIFNDTYFRLCIEIMQSCKMYTIAAVLGEMLRNVERERESRVSLQVNVELSEIRRAYYTRRRLCICAPYVRNLTRIIFT